jgi:hypothetical protein
VVGQPQRARDRLEGDIRAGHHRPTGSGQGRRSPGAGCAVP